ncbi:MAG: hypothetical protein ACK48W_02700 [Bacteroidota bacterium]|jgi:hypothetical protein
MKIIDFLFFYLVRWFEKRQQKFKRIDPIEKTVYGLGIASVLWILCIDMIIEFYVLKTFSSVIPNFIFVIVALLFMWLYKYIYITKERYKQILERHETGFGVLEKTGIAISISFVFLSLLIPMALAVLLHKMDGSL